MDWRSIVEPPAVPEETVILRGIPVTVPECYGRFRRRRLLTLGGVAFLLHRLIAYSVAVAAHLAAAYVLMFIYLDLGEGDEGFLWAGLHRGDAGEEGKLVEMAEYEAIRETPEPEPEVPSPEAVPEMSPTEPDAPPHADVPPSPEPPPSPYPAAGPDTDAPRPAAVGAGESVAGTPAADAAARRIEEDPIGALRARRAGDLDKLRAGNPHDIVVVAGCYDRVEDVLERLGIPHKVIRAADLPDADLSRTLILLVNCSEAYATFAMRAVSAGVLEKRIDALEKRRKELEGRIDKSGDNKAVYRLKLELMWVTSELEDLRRQAALIDFPKRVVDKIRRFVHGGGYLFTSDWGLTVLELAFPGHLANGGTVGPKSVGLRPRAGKEGHPLLEEAFPDHALGGGGSARKFRWEVDSGSYYVNVLKSSVETLVESPDLARHRAVAVAFRPDKPHAWVYAGPEEFRPKPPDPEPGSGRVLHVISHFQRQATNEGDYALQNMLLNFLLDRVRSR